MSSLIQLASNVQVDEGLRTCSTEEAEQAELSAFHLPASTSLSELPDFLDRSAAFLGTAKLCNIAPLCGAIKRHLDASFTANAAAFTPPMQEAIISHAKVCHSPTFLSTHQFTSSVHLDVLAVDTSSRVLPKYWLTCL